VDGSKPKLGVAFFAARWFEEVVLGKDESARSFARYLDEESGRILERLSRNVTAVAAPVVTSVEKARSAARQFFAEDVDALLFVFLAWSEDEYLLPFRDIMAVRPAILWVSTPYKNPPKKSSIMELFKNSGVVGSFEAFGVLRAMTAPKGVGISGGTEHRRGEGSAPFFVFGSSAADTHAPDAGRPRYKNHRSSDARPVLEDPYTEIATIVRAAAVRKALRTAKLGVLPYRNPQMIVTYIDEFELYSSVGPLIEYISALELRKAVDLVSPAAVREYVEKVRAECAIDSRVTEDNLFASARASLGMESLMFDRELEGLALSDLIPELHEVLGLRPCLYPERLARSANEGDLGGTTAMLMLRMLAGRPVMFTEIFNCDRDTGVVVAGHAGPSNYLIADGKTPVTVTPDYELMDSKSGVGGVWMEFIAAPGRVTMVNFFRNPGPAAGFQMTVLGGESLGGELRVEGYPHAAVRIDPDMHRFLRSCAENGTSHHWAIVHGDVRAELWFLADMLRIKKVMIE
jgi:L-fucose isomerase-like protein